MKIFKALLIYLISTQLVFAGKVQNSIMKSNLQFSKFETEKMITSVVDKFKSFKTVNDYLKVAQNPNLKTKIKKYANAQASRVIYKDGVIHIRTNHLVTKMTVNLNESYVTANGKKIDLRKIKDSEDFWNTIESSIRSNQTSSMFDLLIPNAHAELLLIAIAVISFSVVIDALVSMVSRTKCQQKAKEVYKNLEKVNRQCKEDVSSVMSTQIKKNDTDTARYLQNILNRIDSLRPESLEAASCEEAAQEQFETWEIYRFETCLEKVPGYNPEITSKKLCDLIRQTEKCINEFVDIDPEAISNRVHDDNSSSSEQGNVIQNNGSGTNQ
ncbi:MAG: hypothetical protein EP319_17390 [Deltaproteobacteria bacterium]|nr:MAG: hypothetical protein EP319_17390 [Deltaproteobacteria bacterium]